MTADWCEITDEADAAAKRKLHQLVAWLRLLHRLGSGYKLDAIGARRTVLLCGQQTMTRLGRRRSLRGATGNAKPTENCCSDLLND